MIIIDLTSRQGAIAINTKKLQPIHPGEVLWEEFIEPMGMSQREFANKIGQLIRGSTRLSMRNGA